MPNPFVIAEAGSCHEQTLSNAIKLIQVAKKAEADAVKFQFWSDPHRMRERRSIPEPSKVYDEGSIRPEWLAYLKRGCEGVNILFACTVYLPEDVKAVSQYADVFKTSSFESRDRELNRRISELRGDRPWFVSTGMTEERDNEHFPEEAIKLHCVSAYPCPLEEASLGAIEQFAGYSDHTRCVYTGGLAVASGADYLEVHYRLDSTSPACPDYCVALSPIQLREYIFFARTAAAMRGDGAKRVQSSERMNMQYRVIV